MSNPSISRAAELFRQAAGQGRSTLDAGELKSLLDGLGLAFDAAAPAGAVEVRISLNSTREFGMVISAGLGGIEAELDEGNFRRDRASVYAAAALTDADDFLDLFRRTLWRATGLRRRCAAPGRGRRPGHGRARLRWRSRMHRAACSRGRFRRGFRASARRSRSRRRRRAHADARGRGRRGGRSSRWPRRSARRRRRRRAGRARR